MAPRKKLFPYLFLFVVAALAVLGLAAFRAGPAPKVTIESELPAIGKRTPVKVVVSEPKRGVSTVRVELVQDEQARILHEESFEPLEPWAFWGPRRKEAGFAIEVGSDIVQGLKEGQATIRVVADRAGAWLRFPSPVVETLTMDVKLRPPLLQVLSSRTYVAQGGAETVVYKVSGDSVRDGVMAGDRFFTGYPRPGGAEGERFCLFAAPFDLDDHQKIRLVAEDVVGNQVEMPFIDRFFSKPLQTDTIRLSDDFMARVVPAILAQSPGLSDKGDLLQNYLMINGELRAQNAERLESLTEQTQPEFLWDKVFLQMRNAQVRSRFADRRTYTYDGQPVDQQDHLGFDLASTQRAEIQAANSGIVLLAEYFGIYGNCVVIDHGYGLMSLYGHLSEILVQAGEQVEYGQVIGRSGATGLAGGDHLHFTMMLQGMPVNPQEWWDAHWLHDRLKLKLGDGLPFTD